MVRLGLPVLACLALTAWGCDIAASTGSTGDDAGRGSDDTLVPDSIRAAYHVDASRLALRVLQETGTPSEQPVGIPAAQTDTFYRALISVYNLSHPASDSATRLYALHTGGNPSVNDLLVYLDMTAGWADPWRRQQALTGVAAIDSLMTRYQLRVARFTRLSGLGMGDMFDLMSAGQYNVAALAQRFKATGLVRSAGPNSSFGGSDDIRATRLGSAWRLDYQVAWGDCPSGCLYVHTWSFLAFDAGGVRYAGSSGWPLSARTN